ncbi:stage II sporulation protein M [Nanoarchaeota archaeon]
MVFEFLISPSKAERHPWEMLVIGAVYATLGLFLAYWIFRDYSSMVMVFLMVLASIQIIHSAIAKEEAKDMKFKDKKLLLKSHTKTLLYFMFLFLGFTFALAFWNIVLPDPMSDTLFQVQNEAINIVNQKFVGNVVTGNELADISVTGNAISSEKFLGIIFFNNLKVLFFALLFSFFYGAGAIFILAWNASVIGAAMGNLITALISGGVFTAIFSSFFRYFTHGIFEIAAYFTAALAGGIISIAIIRHDYKSKRFKEVLVDSLDLTILSLLLLLIGALVEVYITPLLF